MNRRLAHCIRACRGLLAAALVAALPALAADDAAEYQAKLEELKRNIEKLQTQLDSAKGERDKLHQALEQTETEIGDLEEKVEEIDTQIQNKDEELEALQEEQQSLRRERQGQQTHVARQVRSLYREGQQGQLRLLLSQQSPERVGRLQKYHDYLLQARQRKLQEYLDTLDQLAEVEPRIRQTQQTLAQRRQQLDTRQRQLQQRQRDRESTLARIESLIDNTDSRLRERQENSARLQALLDEMTVTLGNSLTTAAAPAGTAFSRLRGQLPWPTRGSVRHHFGSPRLGGQLDWKGLVIEGQAGTPVVAVHGGTVVFADYLRGHGLLLIIDHGEGYMSLYAHNQTLLRQVGDVVTGGDMIARMGATGGQTTAGLYFEIRHRGQPTNPGPWLKRA